MQRSSITNATKKENYKEIIFAHFVYKFWQFFKYNVKSNFIFEVETLMGTHQV